MDASVFTAVGLGGVKGLGGHDEAVTGTLSPPPPHTHTHVLWMMDH